MRPMTGVLATGAGDSEAAGGEDDMEGMGLRLPNMCFILSLGLRVGESMSGDFSTKHASSPSSHSLTETRTFCSQLNLF